MSACMSLHMSMRMSVHISILMSIYMSMCMSIHMSMRMSIHMSMRICIHMSMRMSIHTSAHRRVTPVPMSPDRGSIFSGSIFSISSAHADGQCRGAGPEQRAASQRFRRVAPSGCAQIDARPRRSPSACSEMILGTAHADEPWASASVSAGFSASSGVSGGKST